MPTTTTNRKTASVRVYPFTLYLDELRLILRLREEAFERAVAKQTAAA